MGKVDINTSSLSFKISENMKSSSIWVVYRSFCISDQMCSKLWWTIWILYVLKYIKLKLETVTINLLDCVNYWRGHNLHLTLLVLLVIIILAYPLYFKQWIDYYVFVKFRKFQYHWLNQIQCYLPNLTPEYSNMF